MTQVIQNVSDTAFLVAGFRAAETEREMPLFRDTLAAKLAGEHGRNILATVPKSFLGAWSVVIRTVIIDRLIEQAIKGGVDTVLNLGTGLDTRPNRMGLPRSLRWIEVDYPHVTALKDARLAGATPRCQIERSALRYISEEAERLGRPIPLPLWLRLWVRVAGLFTSRARRERMRRFAAYVLLVPK